VSKTLVVSFQRLGSKAQEKRRGEKHPELAQVG